MASSAASSDDTRAVVQGFWDALYARDWDAIASFFGPDSIYYDVPVGPAAAAKGPESIVKRLRLGLEPLAGYEHGEEMTIIVDGEDVATEHLELWEWPTGEKAALPFTSVMKVRDGVITRWKDYWDYQTLIDNGPPTWQDDLNSGDLSWIFDATGIA